MSGAAKVKVLPVAQGRGGEGGLTRVSSFRLEIHSMIRGDTFH